MIRIPVLHYKKVIIDDKVYELISASKWIWWWEFLASDDKDNLYRIEMDFYPEQEEELDKKLTTPDACLLLEKYKAVRISKLTPLHLQWWNMGNMKTDDELENSSLKGGVENGS